MTSGILALGNNIAGKVGEQMMLELFEERGGRVIYHTVMASDLGGLAPMCDLTIIAAGKGELVEMFDRDASKWKYTIPGRHLSAMYLNGVEPGGDRLPCLVETDALHFQYPPGAEARSFHRIRAPKVLPASASPVRNCRKSLKWSP